MPPFTGVAVKPVLVPAHIIFPGAAEMLTEGTTFGFTVNARLFEEAVAVDEQAFEEVTTQLIISPFIRELVE